MNSLHLVITTVESAQDAQEIANKVIEAHLAACVNVFPGVSSYYRWQGKVQREQEFMLILKTSTDRVQELMEILRSQHPYEVPEIVSFRAEEVDEPYLNWVRVETQKK